MIRWLYLAIGTFGLIAAVTAVHFNGWRVAEKASWLLIDITRLIHHR